MPRHNPTVFCLGHSGVVNTKVFYKIIKKSKSYGFLANKIPSLIPDTVHLLIFLVVIVECLPIDGVILGTSFLWVGNMAYSLGAILRVLHENYTPIVNGPLPL